MNAVIVGCGKVGTELAATLVGDGHNVSVIDNNQKALDNAAEEIDLLTLCGNGADINMLRAAGLDKADIFIAVSPSDELNLLSCLIAERVGQVKTIARVRNPLYSKETDFLRQKLGLCKIINPEQAAALEIFKLLQYPALSRIDSIARGAAIIFKLHIKAGSALVGRDLQGLREDTGCSFLACVAERKNELFIPSGTFTFAAGDDVTFVSTQLQMQRMLNRLHIANEPAKTCLITGGGTIAYYLTEELLRHGLQVRIIENKPERCQLLSETLPDAQIVQGDGTDRRFLLRQGMQRADAFVPLTGIDEENIVIATYAKNCSNAKVITKVNRTDLYDVIDALDIDSVVFPKLICADIIAQYVRAQNDGVGGTVETLYRYLDNRVEIVEFRAKEDPALVDIPFSELNFKENLIVACMIRAGVFLVPSGRDYIEAGDSVIIVTLQKGILALHDILA